MIWATDSSTSCFRWLYRTFLSFVAKNIVVAQSLTCVWLFVTPFTAAHRVSLFFTISQSSLKLIYIEVVMPSNHLILSSPSPPALSISQHLGSFPRSWLFEIKWPKDWHFNFSPSREHNQLDFSVDHLMMFMCRILLLKECLPWPVCSFDKTVSLCPASFCTPNSNLPVILNISWFPTFAFQSSLMKRTSFFGVNSRRFYSSSQNQSASWSSVLVAGVQIWITMVLNDLPWKQTEIFLPFLRLHLRLFCWLWGLLRFF